MNLQHAFPGQDEFWEGKDFDILKYIHNLSSKRCTGIKGKADEYLCSVWRPLLGPNDDWPLALCDWTTIDPETDIRLNDALRRDRIDENSLLHFNEAHKWYYIKNQTPEDLIVFRNADSQGKRSRESPSTKHVYTPHIQISYQLTCFIFKAAFTALSLIKILPLSLGKVLK